MHHWWSSKGQTPHWFLISPVLHYWLPQVMTKAIQPWQCELSNGNSIAPPTHIHRRTFWKCQDCPTLVATMVTQKQIVYVSTDSFTFIPFSLEWKWQYTGYRLDKLHNIHTILIPLLLGHGTGHWPRYWPLSVLPDLKKAVLFLGCRWGYERLCVVKVT